MKRVASDYYKNRQGNCAQSVAAAWHAKKNSHADLVSKLSGCGHGRAPEGLCGALHAVHRIVDSESVDKLTRDFSVATGGHITCKEIRNSGKLSCVACVETAAELLDGHLAEKG
jgi:hypothetical protein